MIEMNEVNKKSIHSKRRNKKILLLICVLGISILFLTGITYAWFIGIGTVTVNNFTVNMTTSEYLSISLDGYTWSNNISVNENLIKGHSDGGVAYNNNSNSWVTNKGLVPVSSSGDNTNGRLDIFSKSSLIKKDYGYQILANKLDNSSEETQYYVAFDIFIKNESGDYYNKNYNLADDENIYLTPDSGVTSSSSGDTSFGIQNTARIAFVQLGRISLDDVTSGSTPTIKCDEPASSDKYTPLCDAPGNVYNTVIYEPNETSHDSRLVNYFNNICFNRMDLGESFEHSSVHTENHCTALGPYVKTNTIKRNITSSDDVEIYDGYNGYDWTVQEDLTPAEKPLQATKTFTDTMKNTKGQYTFMKIHPHSITKIRVYVYLEGQDVDNYDLVSNAQDIKVQFGFTREREYYGELLDDETPDIPYVGKTIPAGCTYTTVDNTVYNAGQEIPSDYESQEGDIFETSDYIYMYNKTYFTPQDWKSLPSLDGWNVMAKVLTKSSYEPLYSSINGKKLKDMGYTFMNCTKITEAPVIPNSVTNINSTFSNCRLLVDAPVIPNGVTTMSNTFANCTSLTASPAIPDSVTNMSYTFGGCTSLTESPAIPNGVTNMDSTFSGCESLTKVSAIPSSVTDMDFTFEGCRSLTGSIEINANPTDYNYCLYLTQITEITGSTTLKDEILATKLG